MVQTLHEAYLEYLGGQIAFEGGSFVDLLWLMHEKEFVWFVPNDDNRIADGLDIRKEWLQHVTVALDEDPVPGFDFPCSFLEVLLALSRRMAFQAGDPAEGWAWQFLINLDLNRMRDDLSKYKTRKADDIMETVIFRTYANDGAGGFFPLTHPRANQKKVELWYQMSAYIEEILPDPEY